jgi:hypothetical protein
MNDTNAFATENGTVTNPSVDHYYAHANAQYSPITFWFIVICVIAVIAFAAFRFWKTWK